MLPISYVLEFDREKFCKPEKNSPAEKKYSLRAGVPLLTKLPVACACAFLEKMFYVRKRKEGPCACQLPRASTQAGFRLR